MWRAAITDLPAGTVIVDTDDGPCLLGSDAVQPFTFAGWATPRSRPTGDVDVLTPPTSVQALRGGFVPTLHPTALR